MVYLEHSKSKFWKCERNGKACEVLISYGKCGSNGRTMTKSDFTKITEMNAYIKAQTAVKMKAGYEKAREKAAAKKNNSDKKSTVTSAAKKSTTTTTITTTKKKAAATKKRKKGPNIADDEDVLNVVETGLVGEDAALYSRAKVHGSFRAKLVLVDAAKNMDKFYILQILVDEEESNNTKKAKMCAATGSRRSSARNKKSHGPQYYVFARWGRTGTKGQVKLDPHLSREENAKQAFASVFYSKTGLAWDSVVANFSSPATPKKGKYALIPQTKQTNSSNNSSWYYYLQHDPLGKSDGWYKYDDNNQHETEALHEDWVHSNHANRLSTRLTHSASSGFTYKIDLLNMTQQNTRSGTVRPIRRSESGDAPTEIPQHGSRISDDGESESEEEEKKMSMNISVDDAAPSHLQSGSVLEDYDAMLNQTNLCHNNNKFYKLQVIGGGNAYYCFTKWGRVGETGAKNVAGPFDKAGAVKEFQKKFQSKTGNAWNARNTNNFVSKTGKYDLIEMDHDGGSAPVTPSSNKSKKNLPCALESKTKAFVDLIFDEDMFKTAMATMNLDVAKLPLGALSKSQIGRGLEALGRLEKEIKNNASNATLMAITSEFYTIIPHAFGRQCGPVLNSIEMVTQKYDMLNTLADIEMAQSMQNNNNNDNDDEADSEGLQAHPSDQNYEQLAADLSLLTESDAELTVLETYLNNTKASYPSMDLRHVWKVNRHQEEERFLEHAELDNRRLLWHGTNVAVVAAILKSGLRIMQHSGGRVGRGIYLADQHEKSAGYTQAAQGTTVMFLVEAALGNVHEIIQDDSSLTQAPRGYDSVLAKGRSAPDHKDDTVLQIDGNDVAVPQTKPVAVTSAQNSSFWHNEFLIYKESQHRIRYVLTFDS